MPTFDGVNLIVTLDSGVTEVDVREDIYEGWKDWLLGNNSNMKFPQLFRPVGGDPLTGSIDAGAYFFLNNTAGWRIRPPEEDITIYLTGNLVVETTTLPALVPTTGAYTAAILGIQPVTQIVNSAVSGLTAAESAQLAKIDTVDVRTAVMEQIARNESYTDPTTGDFVILSDDGLSELYRIPIWENVAKTTPYDGVAINRRERIE